MLQAPWGWTRASFGLKALCSPLEPTYTKQAHAPELCQSSRHQLERKTKGKEGNNLDLINKKQQNTLFVICLKTAVNPQMPGF